MNHVQLEVRKHGTSIFMRNYNITIRDRSFDLQVGGQECCFKRVRIQHGKTIGNYVLH
jgi:hypothetical protein